jgi:hypothetical protein
MTVMVAASAFLATVAMAVLLVLSVLPVLIDGGRSGGDDMKITRIDAFQVRWTPNEPPTQHSAFVRIFTDQGIDGIGEASPMQGGLASLGIIKHDLAPALISKDPLDHGVLLDTLMHTHVKLGPEGAGHRPMGYQGQTYRAADIQIAGRRLAHRDAILRLDRRQR